MLEIGRNKRANKDLNLLPVINLIFLLLIFFMVAGTIEKFDVIPVDLPIADSGKVLEEGQIVVLLGTHGEILLNDEFIEPGALPELLRKELDGHPEKVISVKGDAMLPAAKIIRMMDVVRAAGGKNLSLVTQSAQ